MNITPYSQWDGKFPALVADMPNDVYHAQDGISNSGLSLVARSPAHYYHAARTTGSRAMEIGTAFHTALLEPERYDAEYMVVADVNDRRVAAYKDAAKVYGADRTLTASEGASVAVMRESIRSNQAANDLLTQPGTAELSAFVRDPETGVLMRCRFDWLTDLGVCLDLKKTQDCREFAFSKSLHNYRYHVQAAMYAHIYELVFGKPIEAFKILAVEEQPPCANVLYDIDPLALQHGHALYRQALADFAQALETENWPTYTGTGVVTLPEYVLMALDNDDEGIF
jgi:exodeoxyribonuclease VIII